MSATQPPPPTAASASPARGAASPARGAASLRSMTAGTLLFLLAQLLLGMAVNLFVKITRSHPGANADYFAGSAASLSWVVSNGELWIRIHAVLGALLLLTAIALLVRSIRLGQRGPIVTSSVGLFGVLAAAANGASFLVYAEDFSSMLMASGLALAVGAYGVALARLPAL